ncbi:helix-turn-helix transcriptional regulator [Lactobacillus crispatus]|uniref:Helix-turn-helix domain-containing protein n=1 Tax=Lactobacillus crispatus TaxID=47770 RepID=A0A7H9E8I0_9LACO|nr:helix-turn-helix transcriptional regulator [Lactobacillus crispatus]QLL73839.1 helix-turn-helix domain-containing protein [Lactobacillus crispatus]
MKRRPIYAEIKAWMVLHDIKQKDFAKTLGTSTSFINRKLNGRDADFTLNEARKLSDVYGLPIKYFFTPKVPKSEQSKEVTK